MGNTRVRMVRFVGALVLVASALTAIGTAPASAETAPDTLPTGGNVVAGSASITIPEGGAMSIVQASDSAIIDWDTFSIGSAADVTITQPSLDSILLLRVVGSSASDIHGRITSNGRVFLVNSTEILLQTSSTVTVGSLVASVGFVSDVDFLAGADTGQFTFQQLEIGANINHYGTISTSPGGTAALIGRPVSVRASGVIDAPGGTVAQVAAAVVTLDFFDDGLTQVTISDPEGVPGGFVRNDGRLTADGGQVVMVASAIEESPGVVVGDSATVRAHSRTGGQNRIALDAGRGNVIVGYAGLDASGVEPGTDGGDIGLSGGLVSVGASVAEVPEPCSGPDPCTVIDASGDAGGGTVTITSDQWTGLLPDGTADTVIAILSDAVASGSGGTITVTSDEETRVTGQVRISSSGIGGGATAGQVVLGEDDSFTRLYDTDGEEFVGAPDIVARSADGASRPAVGSLLPFGVVSGARWTTSAQAGPVQSRSAATDVDIFDGLLSFDTATVSCATTDGGLTATTEITGLASNANPDLAGLDLSVPNVEVDIEGLGHVVFNQQVPGATSDGRRSLTVNGLHVVNADGEEMTLLQGICLADNAAPVAAGDSAATIRDQGVTVDVLANDVDPDGDPLHVTATTQPANGTATCPADGACVYTPVTGFTGVDTFTYTVTDGIADATATVTVTVLEPLEIGTEALPGGAVGGAYSTALEIAGGTPPYAAQVSAGTLPAGLALSSDGEITGTPTGPAGTSEFTVTVTDASSPAQTASRELAITIDRGETTLTVDPVLLQVRGGAIKVTVGIVTAHLTGGDAAAGLPGETLVVKAGRTTVCTTATDDNGDATCELSLLNTLRVVLAGGVTVEYAGSATWQPAEGSAGLL